MLTHLGHALRSSCWWVGNVRRRLERAPGFVLFLLEGGYPDLPPPAEHLLHRLAWLSRPRPNLWELGEAFRTVARDPRVRGVVLHLRPLRLPFAGLQAVRSFVAGLRAAGKRVVAWAPGYDTPTYYVACAAGEILLQPGGVVGPLGLQRGYLFLADVLERLGVKADLMQISPYKTAADPFLRRDLSAEAREMGNWLLDSDYQDFLHAVAEGRRLEGGVDAARQLVDGAPYGDRAACEAGAVDALLHEEELPAYLARGGGGTGDSGPARPGRPALQPWEAARHRLVRPPPPRPGRYVALIRIEGTIVEGWSARPPLRLPVPLLTDSRAGDLTVVQQARRALADPRAAAVVVYINSRGGSASASEAMAAALRQVAARKPLVVAMGPVAASGGYYVATAARWIVAQPGTLTGSIGVLGGKFVEAGLLDRLAIRHETLRRGARAAFYSPERPFTPEEREWVWQLIARTYELFLDRVAESRRMPRDTVDRVGGGRVWTGRQALANGLVDELGGLEQALAKARELAGLGPRAPVREIPATRCLAAPAGPLAYCLETLRALARPAPLCLCPLIVEEREGEDTIPGSEGWL